MTGSGAEWTLNRQSRHQSANVVTEFGRKHFARPPVSDTTSRQDDNHKPGDKTMSIESFTEKTLDGYTIQMRMIDDCISFGGRFDEYARCYTAGLTKRSKQIKIDDCFDWFRNYAPLIDLKDQSFAWRCFRRACSVCSDDRRNAFWRFMDGKKLRAHGKHSIRYV